jgi:hypothetical protein
MTKVEEIVLTNKIRCAGVYGLLAASFLGMPSMADADTFTLNLSGEDLAVIGAALQKSCGSTVQELNNQLMVINAKKAGDAQRAREATPVPPVPEKPVSEAPTQQEQPK